MITPLLLKPDDAITGKIMKRFIPALVLGAYSLSAQSALIDRGGGLIYDDVLDLTWLQDANYSQSSGYDADGRMSWYDATAWAEDLEYYDSVRDAIYDDWRLPTIGNGIHDPVYCGSASERSCRTNEFGHLYHHSGVSTSSPEPFVNVQPYFYWSSTILNAQNSYYFLIFSGNQTAGSNAERNYAWAVRDGDVAAVPISSAFWLFGSALGLILTFRKQSR